MNTKLDEFDARTARLARRVARVRVLAKPASIVLLTASLKRGAISGLVAGLVWTASAGLLVTLMVLLPVGELEDADFLLIVVPAIATLVAVSIGPLVGMVASRRAAKREIVGVRASNLGWILGNTVGAAGLAMACAAIAYFIYEDIVFAVAFAAAAVIVWILVLALTGFLVSVRPRRPVAGIIWSALICAGFGGAVVVAAFGLAVPGTDDVETAIELFLGSILVVSVASFVSIVAASAVPNPTSFPGGWRRVMRVGALLTVPLSVLGWHGLFGIDDTLPWFPPNLPALQCPEARVRYDMLLGPGWPDTNYSELAADASARIIEVNGAQVLSQRSVFTGDPFRSVESSGSDETILVPADMSVLLVAAERSGRPVFRKRHLRAEVVSTCVMPGDTRGLRLGPWYSVDVELTPGQGANGVFWIGNLPLRAPDGATVMSIAIPEQQRTQVATEQSVDVQVDWLRSGAESGLRDGDRPLATAKAVFARRSDVAPITMRWFVPLDRNSTEVGLTVKAAPSRSDDLSDIDGARVRAAPSYDVSQEGIDDAGLGRSQRKVTLLVAFDAVVNPTDNTAIERAWPLDAASSALAIGSAPEFRWWKWQSPGSGEVSFRVRGTRVSYVVGLFGDTTEAPEDRFEQIGVAANQVLYVRTLAEGPFLLEWAFSEVRDSPSNDNRAGAEEVMGPSGSVRGNNEWATREIGDEGSSTLWWQWEAPAEGFVTFDAGGSDIDTVVAAFSDDKALQAVDPYAYDGGVVHLAVQQGERLALMVGSSDPGEIGTVRLNWTLERGAVSRPSNDRREYAVALSAAPSDPLRVSVTANNREATTSADDPWGMTATLWWSWVAPSDGRVTFDTKGSEIHPALAVLDEKGGLLRTSTSTIELNVHSGDRLLIVVGSSRSFGGGVVGAVRLNSSIRAADEPRQDSVNRP